MLENFTALEVCVFVALVVFGLIVLISVIAPAIYGWCDRWLDRSRNSIEDKVTSTEQKGE